MRPIVLIALGLLLAAAPPAFASPALQDAAEQAQPRGERWDERWQGRHHWLYDDAAPGVATDGAAANAQGHCRTVPVRTKRSDGTTVQRRIRRCD
jgi:hypothetical protein